MRAPRDRRAGADAADRPVVEVLLELGLRAFVASPRQRDRQPAAFSHRLGQCELRAVGDAVPVLGRQQREEEHPRSVRADRLRRVAGITGQRDCDRPFVDDDDDDDLGGVGDRGKTLEHLDVVKALRRAEALGDVGRRRRRHRRADLDAGQLRDVLIGDGEVAVDADCGDDLRGRRGLRTHDKREREQRGRAHGQRSPPTRNFALTSACR